MKNLCFLLTLLFAVLVMPENVLAQTKTCSAAKMAKCKAATSAKADTQNAKLVSNETPTATKSANCDIKKCKSVCGKNAKGGASAVNLFTSLTSGKKANCDPTKCDITKCTPEQIAKCKKVCTKNASQTKVAMKEDAKESTKEMR